MALSASEIAAVAYKAGVHSRSGLEKSVAIALAESGGDPSAVGDKGLVDATWGPSIGLWQIRSLKSQSGTRKARDGTVLSNPAANALSMYSLSSNGTNWNAWTTYTNGAYLKFLSTAKGGASAVLGSSSTGLTSALTIGGGSITDRVNKLVRQIGDEVTRYFADPSSVVPTDVSSGSSADNFGDTFDAINPLAGIVQPITQAVEIADRARKWLGNPDNWVRVSKVMIGMSLLGIGLYLVSKPIVEPVVSGTAKVAKKAAVVAAL